MPSLVGYPRHDSLADLKADISISHVSRCFIRASMLNASGITVADLFACIESACMIQILDNHRSRCNRHLRGLNRCPSAYPLLLATPGMTRRYTSIYRLYTFPAVCAWMLNASGMTLADLHAYSDCTCFEMGVHGCSKCVRHDSRRF